MPMRLRIIFFILLLFSVIWMPLWFSIILALIGIVRFSFFWEATFLFFLSDLLLGINKSEFHGVFIVSTVLSFLVIIIAEFLKKKVKSSNTLLEW